jgi:hypothetical protein
MYSLNIIGETVNVFSQNSSGEFEEILLTPYQRLSVKQVMFKLGTAQANPGSSC